MSFTSKNLRSKSRMGFLKAITIFFLGVSCVLFITRAFEITAVTNEVKSYFNKIIFTASGDNVSATGIVLDGTNGDAYFKGMVGIGTDTPAYQLDVAGTGHFANDLLLSALTNAVVLGTDSNGKIIASSSSDIYNLISGSYSSGDIYNLISGNIFNTNNSGDIYNLISGYALSGPTGATGVAGANGATGAAGSTGPAGAGTPARPVNSVQFNDGGSFSGTSNLVWYNGKLGIGTNNPTEALTVSGNMRFTHSGVISAAASTSNQIYLDTNGKVGIGTDTPDTALDVAGFGGQVTAVTYFYSSDKRLKTDITSITDPLAKILALNGYMFTWRKTGKKDMGVIAQEVEKMFPEIVHTNTEGYKSVEYGNLIAPLIEAIKELNAKVDAQAQAIKSLQSKIGN